MNTTIDYYNQNAEMFTNDTVNIDFSQTQDRFLHHLEAGGYILDFGCGAGRDTKYFLKKGFSVDAIDGSEELCRIASDYTGITVQHKMFQDFTSEAVYDGIWCCASLLHLHSDEMMSVLTHLRDALKAGGLIYASFKYGPDEKIRNGRYFNDFTEDKFTTMIGKVPGLKIMEFWITGDARENRGSEQWLNIFLKKN